MQIVRQVSPIRTPLLGQAAWARRESDDLERVRHKGRSSWVNVGPAERWISLAAGAALASLALKQRDWKGVAAVTAGTALIMRGLTGHCYAYQTLGVNPARHGSAQPTDYFERGIHIERALTINADRQRLYDFWRNLSNLSLFMRHLKSVTVIDDLHSHWIARGPLNADIEWDAEIINDQPPELLAWRSLADAEVDNAGSVRFLAAPAGRGTQVKVTLDYIPTAGRLGAMVAKWLGAAPSQQIADDLRRFKQLIETGEIATTEGQPCGPC